MACCANCAALRERVHELERELGLRMETNGVARLRHELGIEPMSARAVLLLYQAKGAFIPSDRLVEASGHSSYANMRTRLSRVRYLLGKDFILASWGQGYKLGPRAMKTVADILARPA